MSFDAAVVIVIGVEGGLTNDGLDKGGRTKYGISQAAYPSLDIVNLSLADASRIYHTDYWLRTRCDVLPMAVALLVFDSAVNNGPSKAIEFLQESLGVAADLVIGPVTLRAIEEADATDLLNEYMARRMFFMGTLPGWTRFGLGWSRRLLRVLRDAATMTEP